MMKRKIAVIGAGASGLTAIKCCLDEGLHPVCYERSDDIGGLWRYEDGQKKGAAIYKSTVANTSKELAAFSDFPMPKEWPNYLHHTKILEYYRRYADRFKLLEHIKFNMDVLSCTKAPEHKENGKWILKVKNQKNEILKEEEFDGVLVAVGHHSHPNFPKDKFPGINNFSGKITHSHDYRSFEGYEDKNVLVVGIGNSGVDIAVELSLHAKQVYISTRRGMWVFGRLGPFGLPGDFYGLTRYNKLLDDYLPKNWTESRMKDLLTKRFDHELYGLIPEHSPADQDLPARITTGMIKIKTNVNCVKEKSVVFDDETEEDVDCIIFATGYKHSPFLSDSILDVEKTDGFLYKYMWPTSLKHNTLARIGQVNVFGAVNPVVEIQCRWATRVLNELARLPSKQIMYEDIRQKREKMENRFYASHRQAIQVELIDYMDQIAEQIGAKPNIPKLFFTDYALAKKILYEVSSPYQYRLFGPGRWGKARETIMTQKERMLFPLHTRKVKKEKKGNSFIFLLWILLMAGFAICLTKFYGG